MTTKKLAETKGVEVLQLIAQNLLNEMGTEAEAEVSEDKVNDAFVVSIKSENEAGLLIGNRGKTIEALQIVLGIIYRRKTDEWKRILVNIADWREKEEERLEGLAKQTADRATETGLPQELYNLTPAQRRVVHLALSENPKVSTESKGEGRERYLVVTPKK